MRDKGSPMHARDIAGEDLPATPVALFYAWWRGDPLLDLPIPAGLVIERDPPLELIGLITGLPRAEIERRIELGNCAFATGIAGTTGGIGWSSAGRVSIGELGLSFTVPPGNRYLWDFVTVPAWRGQGIYPVLLQAILAHESDAERFWVGHALGNVASARDYQGWL